MTDYLDIEESFWGVCLEPSKKYSQTVDKSVHVSMAAIDPSVKGSKEMTSLWCEKEQTSYLICSLGQSSYQQHLDLNFNEGETVTLFTKGHGTIHLTGYLHLDTDFGSDDDANYMDGEEDVCDFSDEAEAVEEPKIEAVKKRKLEGKLVSTPKKSKMDMEEEEEEDKSPKKVTTSPKQVKKEVKQAEEKVEGEIKKKKKKKKKKTSSESEVVAASTSAPQKGGGKRKVGEGGVVIENVKEGHGPEALVGKNVKVYYTGKLESGKIFDANTSGTPFSFKLGRKEVIAGWDVGLAGMKVGGKRKLTIPAKMAYGSQKLQGIPPNSTLVFDVELKAVK